MAAMRETERETEEVGWSHADREFPAENYHRGKNGGKQKRRKTSTEEAQPQDECATGHLNLPKGSKLDEDIILEFMVLTVL